MTSSDFSHTLDGFVRLWEDYTKQDKYREAPVPPKTAHTVEALVDSLAPDKSVVDVDGSTVSRCVQRAAERRYANTRDKGWTYLDVHDLRRTWGRISFEPGRPP